MLPDERDLIKEWHCPVVVNADMGAENERENQFSKNIDKKKRDFNEKTSKKEKGITCRNKKCKKISVKIMN